MDWTGSLYFIDTNKCGKWVLENLKQCFHEKYHYTFQDNSDEEWDYLLFYRDKKMLNHHLEKGYNDDMDGKGCFGIEAKNVDLKAIATVILPLLMDRISRIKCSSMAAYRRWLDEAFHGCKTTANEWHGLQHRSNY